MDDLRTGSSSNNANRFNPTMLNTSTLMTVLIGLVIIILLIMLFQSSSNGGGSSGPAAPTGFAVTNPLNATMRNNPLVNTPQRAML